MHGAGKPQAREHEATTKYDCHCVFVHGINTVRTLPRGKTGPYRLVRDCSCGIERRRYLKDPPKVVPDGGAAERSARYELCLMTLF